LIFLDHTNYLSGSDKQLPKEQRRGAIMILGMLALAKRGVVTDHVDTLLKVGCGYLGKVNRVLNLLFDY
jgi:condensin complex subunit 1